MIICEMCHKPITTKTFWWRWYNKGPECLWEAERRPICDECAATIVDEHSNNGLMLGFNMEADDEDNG